MVEREGRERETHSERTYPHNAIPLFEQQSLRHTTDPRTLSSTNSVQYLVLLFTAVGLAVLGAHMTAMKLSERATRMGVRGWPEDVLGTRWLWTRTPVAMFRTNSVDCTWLGR